MAKLRQGDQVILIAGKDKGKQGKLLVVKGDKVKVEGLNIVKKHRKPNRMTGEEGAIVEQEAFLDISNVAIFNTQTQKADRIGYQVEKDDAGKIVSKARVYKSTGETVATA